MNQIEHNSPFYTEKEPPLVLSALVRKLQQHHENNFGKVVIDNLNLSITPQNEIKIEYSIIFNGKKEKRHKIVAPKETFLNGRELTPAYYQVLYRVAANLARN